MTAYLVALALLTSPPDSAEALATPAAWAHKDTLRSLAVAWEILDAREADYYFVNFGEFATDLRIVQCRHEELRDAPPLSDAARLPPREVANHMLQFNRAFHEHLTARRATDFVRPWLWDDFVSENNRRYRVWDDLRDARQEFYYAYVKRLAMKRVREAMGAADYYAGAWPDPVPRAAFTRAD